MNDISLAFPVNYPQAPKYCPLIRKYSGVICKCYGYKYSTTKNDKCIDKKRLSTTAFPLRFDRVIISPLRRIFNYPQYYSYLGRIKLLDIYCSIRIKRDKSLILFVSPLLCRTIKEAKRLKKIVVLEAGNSEPNREYKKITEHYEKYSIRKKYIYGDPIFKNICNSSLKEADYIVSISKVSLKTYLDAGYPSEKLRLIPLTGTDFPLQSEFRNNRKKAFISTGFHSFIKGTHSLLLAWRQADIKDIPLIIVGRICEDLQEFIEKFGPFNNVIFTGHQNNLKDWYKDYDGVGVLMSLSEGAVRATPEMMSFGFPMIVSPDATCDLVVNGKNGFIVEEDNIDAIAEKLKWFASDWSRTYYMREEVLQSVKNRTVEDYSLEVGGFLETLITMQGENNV